MNIVRESIFSSAIRSFFKVLLGFIGLAIGLCLIGLLLIFTSSPYDIQDKVNITILPDENGSSTVLGHHTPVILQLDIIYEIGTDLLLSEQVISILNSSREGLLANNRVKAILLNINSPGGAVNDADDIYRALLAYKEKFQVPIYAYVSGLCASGAYYIACAADHISTSPTSIVGSIGVIMGPQFNFSGLMDRYGVKAKVLTQGINKAPFLPFIHWPEGEEAKKAEAPMRALAEYFYKRFVSIVSTARPDLSQADLMNDYGANVYAAEKAKELGYIDNANSTREEALAALSKIAGIENEYQCLSLGLIRPFFPDVFQSKFSLQKVFSPQNPRPYHRFFYLME